MYIYVFSDTHGNTSTMEEAVESAVPAPALVVHLGDGADEAEALMRYRPDIAFLGVRGNCDRRSADVPDTRFVEVGGVKIMLTHGHLFGVKSSRVTLACAAAREGAALALYGHTHVRRDESENVDGTAVRTVCPGSSGMNGEYAVVSVEDGKIEDVTFFS